MRKSPLGFLTLLLSVTCMAQVNTALTPAPKFQFINGNGFPLAGGCLFSYVTGTSTPLATYTDATGLTANANPVILDANGSANVWLGPQKYRLQLFTAGGIGCASGAQIWQVDGVAGNNIQNNTAISLTAQAAPTCNASQYILWADSTANRWKFCNNGVIDTVVGQNTTDTLNNKTISGATFSGTSTFAGPITASGNVTTTGTTSTSKLNSILYVDGITFTTIDSAIASVPSFSIVASTGCTESSNVATCTTTSPHGFLVGQTVFVTGVAVNGYNGTFTITAVTTSTFSYFDCVGQNPSSPTFCTTGLATSGSGTVAPLATVIIPNSYRGADVATCTSLDPAGNPIGYFYSVTPPNITVVDYRSGATCAYNVAWNGNSLASNPNNLTLWRRDTSPTTTTSNIVTDLQLTGSYPNNGAAAGGTFEVDTIGNLSPPSNGIIQATNGQFAVRSKGGTIFQIMGTSGGGGIDRSYDTTNITQASGMYAFYPTNASTSGATITDAYGLTATFTSGIATRNNEAIYSQGPLLFLDQSGIDIQNAAGAVGPTAQPIMRFGGVCGSAGTCGVSVFTPNASIGPMIKLVPQGSAHTNWEISDQNNVNNGIEITPSSAAGGFTFSNPAVTLLQNGNGGTLNIFGSTSGNSALNAPATAGTTNNLPPTTAAFTGGTLIPLQCLTSQKTESAADANVLTCAIPAQAGTYRISFVLSLSAASAATLGWTATWTDSNGAAQTPANLALFQSSVAAPALTFTTSAVGNYYGNATVDVNNAGTSIVIKLTFSGTSFTGKVSAAIERII